MRPLCCDQLETLTQGYYPGVDSPVINEAPHFLRPHLLGSKITVDAC